MADLELIERVDQPPEQTFDRNLFVQVVEREPTHHIALSIYSQVLGGNTSNFHSRINGLSRDVRDIVLSDLYNTGNAAVRGLIARHFPQFRPNGLGETSNIVDVATIFGVTSTDLAEPGNACTLGVDLLQREDSLPGRFLAWLRNSIPGITSNPERTGPFGHNNPVGLWDIWGTVPHMNIDDPTNGAMRPLPAYYAALSRVMANAHTEFSRNHNDVLQLNIRQIMIERGLDPDSNITVVNVDSHSDILRTLGSTHGIADWGNAFIRNNPTVNNYYWVLPDELRSDPRFSRYFAPTGEPNDQFTHGPANIQAYVHNTTGEIRWDNPPSPSDMSQYRTVNIRIRTMSQMDNLAGQNVVLTTDLDTFANRGYDTYGDATTRYQGAQGFQRYVDMLSQRGIRPFLHFLSFSPEYIQRNREAWNGILQFAALSAQASPEGMSRQFTYHQNRVYPGGPHEHDGIALSSQGNRGMQLILALFQIDAQSQVPNGIINLATDNPERRRAIAAARRIYNADSDEQALAILRRFTPDNQTLNFRLMWQAMRDMCRTRFR